MPRSLNRRDALKLGLTGAAASAAAVTGAAGATLGARPAAAATALGDVFNVRDHGAQGDGTTIDSPAINAAIDAAAATGGGTVYFPPGVYASYSVRLKSNIELFLDKGAVLYGASRVPGSGYDPPGPGPGNNYQDFGHSFFRAALIWGEELENIGIRGPGMINGQGLVRNMSQFSPSGTGDKAISLKLCRNVVIQDVTIINGGHLTILPTGVDNLTIHNVKIDTIRDAINVDCCRNVRISDSTINTHGDDAIVLKSSFALNFPRATENVSISNCLVSGYDIGTVLDGTFERNVPRATDRDGPTGRIKFGTESNAGFKNIAISNVLFDRCRGLTLLTVDGGLLEDVTVSNVTMREVSSAPMFLRLARRMRGPAGVPVGKLRRINISNVLVHDADPRYPAMLMGVPGHDLEDIRISDVRIHSRGGLSMQEAADQPSNLTNTFFTGGGSLPPREPFDVPERETTYPECSTFGVMPAYGFYVRHAQRLQLHNVEVLVEDTDTRPAIVLDDVKGAEFRHCQAQKAAGAPTFVLRDVHDFNSVHTSPVNQPVQVPRLSGGPVTVTPDLRVAEAAGHHEY